MAWRAKLVEDLGGAAQLSTQQLALVDICMRTKLLLDSVDAWLLPSIIDKRRRQLFPVVQQRTALADALARYLGRPRACGQADAAFERLSEPRQLKLS